MKKLFLNTIVVFSTLLLLPISSCDINPIDDDINYDFIDHFNEAEIFPSSSGHGTPNGKLAFVFSDWEVGGEQRDAIITLADGHLTYKLSGSRKSNTIYFGVGTNATVGDGVTGFIIVEYLGILDTVYKRYLNPVGNATDRHWFDQVVNISKYNGKNVNLIFAANRGPDQDDTADWFGWSTPVILDYGSNNPVDITNDYNYDFVEHFSEATLTPSTSGHGTPNGKMAFVFNNWEVGSEARTAIVTLAGCQLTFSLNANRKGNKLYFGVGMATTVGDGANGFILIESEGKKDTVFQRYLNPAGSPSDRFWFDEYVDLSVYDQKDIKLTFTTNLGPDNDDTGDWFGWSTPIISPSNK
jgi:hypothetical protein